MTFTLYLMTKTALSSALTKNHINCLMNVENLYQFGKACRNVLTMSMKEWGLVLSSSCVSHSRVGIMQMRENVELQLTSRMKSSWGNSFIDETANYIKENCPGIKGFNRRGLYRMRQFYETYKDNEFVSPLVTQISWTNHLVIMSGTKEIEENFVLEIGKDFAFIGDEYRVQVANSDWHIDLLFHHRGLQCLVAFELKIEKFRPEYISKMDFYLEALDREH